MRILDGANRNSFVQALEQRGTTDLAKVEPAVRRIVNDVRRNGDRALRRYTTRWDGLGKDECLRVPSSDLEKAWRETSTDLQNAVKQAAVNIRQYCEWQKPEEWRREIQPGVIVGQLVRPLESVGCYVPGGRYPLPSTLLMTVIPAQVAGCRRFASCRQIRRRRLWPRQRIWACASSIASVGRKRWPHLLMEPKAFRA